MTAATTRAGTVAARPAGLGGAIASEWVKLRTVRSTVALIVGMGAALPLFSVLVAATGSLMPDDTVLGASLLGGAALAQVLAAVLGALTVTNEFRTGMIRTTLTACPRRLMVLASKSIVVAAVTFAVILPSSLAAHGIGLAMLDSSQHAAGEVFPAVLGVALAISSVSVLGVALGTLIRSSAGATAAVIGVVILPGLLAPLLGDAQRWVGGASLGGVLQKMVQSSDATPETVGSLGAWPSLVVVAAYTLVFVLGAVWVLRRRDT